MPRLCAVLSAAIALATASPHLAQSSPSHQSSAAQGRPFTLQQAMSAPFSNQLTAAPAKNRVAWFTDAEGRRNVWFAGASEPARQVTHNTEDDGQDIDNITWSPDGEQLAWTRGTGAEGVEHPVANPAELAGEIKQNVELTDLHTNVVRVVGEGHSPAFAGTDTLLFLRHGDVWSFNLRDPAAKPQQLLFARGRALNLKPAPGGSRFAFVSQRGDHSFVGVYTFATRQLLWMDPGTGLDHSPAWSPDGKHIAFIREVPPVSELQERWLREDAPWSIRIADAVTCHGREFWRAEPGRGSLFHETQAHDQLIWRNATSLVFPWERDGWLHLYTKSEGSSNAGLLTPGSFEVDAVSARDGEIVYSSNQSTMDREDADRRHLWRIHPSSDKPEQITFGSGIETEPTLLYDGTVAAMHGGSQSPLVPALLGPKPTSAMHDLAPQLLSAGFPGQEFVTPQQVVFPSTDGMAIHGQLFLPSHPAKDMKQPALVFFHGGSRRQMLLGFHPMQYYAQTYEMNQYLASRGYVVLSVNYRSGTGYGMEFRQAEHYGANGASEFNDVLGAAQYLRSRADVDPKRIGAWGGSYGGYLTALALARRSDLFAAGVDLHGVHDWSLELDLWRPSNDPSVDQAAVTRTAFQSSPMASLKSWRSPVLLIQGDDDRNVLFAQTVRLAAALRAQGVDVEEEVFPDEVHDFLLHRTWLAAYGAAADFLDRKLTAK